MTTPEPLPVLEGHDLRTQVSSLCGRFAHPRFPAGDLAELRRMDAESIPGLAFWRLADQLGIPREAEAERRWAVVLSALATLRGLHDPTQRLGQVLAETGLSELRFSRLLRADGPRLFDEVRATAAWLASKAKPANLADLAALVLTREPDKAEALRRHLARDYYRNLSKDADQ